MRVPAILGTRVLGTRVLGMAALPVALVATAGIVTASSYSVFTANTSSPGNSFTTGNVVLKNDSASSSGAQSVSGSALYSSTGMSPSTAAVTRCITVQSSGSLASVVKLYATGATGTNSNDLAAYLDLKVEVGTASGGTNGGSCANFSASSTLYSTGLLSSFESSYPSYASGLGTGWSPTGSATETRAFRFTISPDASMTNNEQSETTSLNLVWEADNS